MENYLLLSTAGATTGWYVDPAGLALFPINALKREVVRPASAVAGVPTHLPGNRNTESKRLVFKAGSELKF